MSGHPCLRAIVSSGVVTSGAIVVEFSNAPSELDGSAKYTSVPARLKLSGLTGAAFLVEYEADKLRARGAAVSSRVRCILLWRPF